jgi:hypothetical protein
MQSDRVLVSATLDMFAPVAATAALSADEAVPEADTVREEFASKRLQLCGANECVELLDRGGSRL